MAQRQPTFLSCREMGSCCLWQQVTFGEGCPLGLQSDLHHVQGGHWNNTSQLVMCTSDMQHNITTQARYSAS